MYISVRGFAESLKSEGEQAYYHPRQQAEQRGGIRDVLLFIFTGLDKYVCMYSITHIVVYSACSSSMEHISADNNIP